MTDPSLAETVPKRADQLVVGDRIVHDRLPSTYAEGPGEVVFVKAHVYRGNASVFVAYVHEDGYYDSTSYLPDGLLDVYPAARPGAFHCPGRAAFTPGSRPVCGLDDWDHDPHDYGQPADPIGASLVPQPIARHYDASDIGTADCACGEAFGTVEALKAHIAAGNAVSVVNEGGRTAVEVAGGLVDIDSPGVAK